MSHFTQVETKINDLVCLQAALVELGLEFEMATEKELVKVRGWKGSTLTAEAKIKASKSYDIGLQLTEEGNYKLIADWWAGPTCWSGTRKPWSISTARWGIPRRSCA